MQSATGKTEKKEKKQLILLRKLRENIYWTGSLVMHKRSLGEDEIKCI